MIVGLRCLRWPSKDSPPDHLTISCGLSAAFNSIKAIDEISEASRIT